MLQTGDACAPVIDEIDEMEPPGFVEGHRARRDAGFQSRYPLLELIAPLLAYRLWRTHDKGGRTIVLHSVDHRVIRDIEPAKRPDRKRYRRMALMVTELGDVNAVGCRDRLDRAGLRFGQHQRRPDH